MDRQAPESPRGPVPSRAATRRLEDGLRREVDHYREALAEDLVDAHLSAERGDHDRAIATLESHLASLERLQSRVQRVVAGALVERDAEDVVDRAVGAGAHAVPPPPPPVHPPVVDVRSAEEPTTEPATPTAGGSLRRGVAAALTLAALAFVGLGPLRAPDPDPLLAAVQASEHALAAAEAAESGEARDVHVLTARSASLHDAIDGLPADVRDEPEVRSWLRMVITEQHAALSELVGTVATVDVLLADLGRLAADLDIPLPPAIAVPTPDVPEMADTDAWDDGQMAEPAPRPGSGPTASHPNPGASPQDRPQQAPATTPTTPATADPEPTTEPTADDDFVVPPLDLDGDEDDQADGVETDFGDADGLGPMSAG